MRFGAQVGIILRNVLDLDRTATRTDLTSADRRALVLKLADRLHNLQTIGGLDTHGRLRAVRSGPDGALYVTTSNGEDDEVLRISPA